MAWENHALQPPFGALAPQRGQGALPGPRRDRRPAAHESDDGHGPEFSARLRFQFHDRVGKRCPLCIRFKKEEHSPGNFFFRPARKRTVLEECRRSLAEVGLESKAAIEERPN